MSEKYETLLPIVISIIALIISIVSALKAELFGFKLKLVVDGLLFPAPTLPSHKSFAIVLPISFINKGYGDGVIEWIAFKAIRLSDKTAKLYSPLTEVDFSKFMQGKRKLHGENIKGEFSSFHLGSKEATKKYILFTQEEENEKYPFSEWSEGEHKFEIYIKTSKKSKPYKAIHINLNINNKMIEDYVNGTSIFISIRDINI